jgi:putative sigma-54 modulation protein
MELQMAGTNLELTPDVRRYIERKLGKLSRHLPTIIDTSVEISEEKTRSPQQHYLVRATVTGGAGGANFHGEERGADLFQAIDRVADILIRQLEHHKGKHYEKMYRGNHAVPGAPVEAAAPPEPTRNVVKVKRFDVKPMSVDEAIEQMEILGHSFFLFYDDDARKVKLLYRRHDGNLGLIEPDIK